MRRTRSGPFALLTILAVIGCGARPMDAPGRPDAEGASRSSPGASEDDRQQRIDQLQGWYAQGDFERVIDEAQRTAARHPAWSEVHYMLGAALASSAQRERAVVALEQELLTTPGHIPSRALLAEVLADLRRHEESLSQLRILRGANPTSMKPERIVLGAQQLVALDRHGEALQWLDAVPSETPDTLALRGEALVALDRLEAARAALEAALSAEPAHLAAMQALGRLELRAGNPLEGRRWLERHARRVQRDDRVRAARDSLRTSGETVDNLLRLGDAEIDAGDLDAGLMAYRSAAQREPGSSRVHLALADALLAAGRTSEAEVALDRAEATGAPEGRIALLRAVAAIQSGDPETADRLAAASRGARPWTATNWIRYAEASADAGDPAAAVDALRQAERLAPDDLRVLLPLTHALISDDRPAEALEIARRAAGSNPGSGDAALARALARWHADGTVSDASLLEAVDRYRASGASMTLVAEDFAQWPAATPVVERFETLAGLR